MSGLNMGIIQGLPVPLVPLEKQKEWSDFVAEAKSTKNRIQGSPNETSAPFASLQHLAFRGGL